MTFTLFATPASLQYVDSADSVRYVQTLVEHRDHLANDPEYLAFVHNERLSYSKNDSKMDSKSVKFFLYWL